MSTAKPKSFWKKPEGIVGGIVLVALIAALALAAGAILVNFGSIMSIVGMVGILGTALFLAVDKKARNLVSYMYKSAMRWITGLFITIDPIAILKSYIEDLKANLRKMNKQISQLRGQMHKLKEVIHNNKKEIASNLELASKARDNDKRNVVILKSRKAGRLKESNMRLEDLYTKMEVLYRVLVKMFENSEILAEDIKDQVMVKEQEYNAIKASNSAMKSAMSVISGDPDKRAMFDAAMEAIADDVSNKVGEMERFMEVSSGFMDSIDLQNGVFEEEGLKMLEKWEKEGASLLLGDDKLDILDKANNESEELDISEPVKTEIKLDRENQYDGFFD